MVKLNLDELITVISNYCFTFVRLNGVWPIYLEVGDLEYYTLVSDLHIIGRVSLTQIERYYHGMLIQHKPTYFWLGVS